MWTKDMQSLLYSQQPGNAGCVTSKFLEQTEKKQIRRVHGGKC